jgi:hypothetical protein
MLDEAQVIVRIEKTIVGGISQNRHVIGAKVGAWP